MTPDYYRKHVTQAAAAVRHLGDAVRGSRAFFIYRDLNDASQPSVIACHPPLTDAAMLACFGNGQLVWESAFDSEGNSTLIGLATDSAFENRELMTELTSLVAQSLAGASPPAETTEPLILPNRATFIEQLKAALRDERDRRSEQVAALVVEVDHFHSVTARFGDGGGEALMGVLAGRIVACLPPTTLIARLGADRFGVIVPAGLGGHAEDRALVTAEEIQLAFREPARLTDEAIAVTASIGIGLGGAHVQASKLLHDIDEGIAMAQRAGGSRTRIFREGMDTVAAFPLLRERDGRLPRAILVCGKSLGIVDVDHD